MGYIFESLCIELAAIAFAILIVYITYYIKSSFNYWKKRNLPYIKPENPFFMKDPPGFWAKSIYDRLKSEGHKHGGFYAFTAPVYAPIDPELIKNVMQRDFSHFVDHTVYYNEKDDPLSAHLFALEGDRWRNLRAKLTSTFTSGKMKMMFETLVKCSDPMKAALNEYARNKTPVDIKEMVACFGTDVIGSTAFGVDCNSFKSPDAEFRKYGRRAFMFSKLKFLQIMFCMSKPKLGRLLGLTMTRQDSAKFFIKVIKDTIHYRETNGVTRKDMLQLLIELRNETSDHTSLKDGKNLTIEEIAAQAFLFFLAGFETSSTTLTFCLFELATNQDVQQKVRDEINEVLEKHNGKITYEAIGDMKYMGQVIDETLRKYPPLTIIDRKCVKDYKVPNTDITIEKGTMVFISPLGLHRDPEYFPNPEKFDPDRFSEENKKKIRPFTYIPFGEGPRICIGLRFGVMQIKVGLTVLLKNYIFALNSKTKLPLELDHNNVVYLTKSTIWLNTGLVD